MDWLEDLFENVKSYMKKVSLKKAMCVYILIAMIFVVILWVITVNICKGWQNVILSSYGIDFRSVASIEDLYIGERGENLLKLLTYIKTYSIFLYSMAAIVITSNYYYNNKIREPLNILKTEADYVARGDLTFQCKYESSDEMAIICNTFNDMRLKLIENNKTMWNLIEEQSHLNAILAHDLRNPLSIVEGYNEMLIKYLPEGKIDEEKLISTLKLMNKQVVRMKEFLNRIKDIRSFSEMRVDKNKREIGVLIDSIYELVKGIEKKDNINISIENQVHSKECFYDLRAIEETVGNIISNAIRFAEKEITITIKLEEDKLHIFVKDDGKGFSQKELYTALEPFYTAEKNDCSHFGIGLNISKILTEKHGGTLTISNSIDGGAIVCAEFLVM